jgi:hypothetical protein
VGALLLSASPNKTARDPIKVRRDVLEAYEKQSGLPDVARFLIDTGRVAVENVPVKSRGE